MKKIAILIGLVILVSSIQAQEDYYSQNEDEFKTIFQRNGDQLRISGFGGPLMTFGTISGEFAHMMGGGGAVIINNFFFGGYGMGLTTSMPHKDEPTLEVGYGHGGFWTGIILGAQRPVHLSLSSKFGWGALSQIDYDLGYVESYPTDAIFVITPIAEVELNFSRFFKVGLGSSMSIVNGIDIGSLYTMEDFLNPTFYLSFKFGWFQ